MSATGYKEAPQKLTSLEETGVMSVQARKKKRLDIRNGRGERAVDRIVLTTREEAEVLPKLGLQDSQ